MVDILLSDWLEEYNSLSESEIRSYAAEQEHNNEVVIALYTVFDEHVKYSKLINQVCNQLFCFYRSGEEELQRFTLQFIPALVLLYLENVNLTHGDRQVCHSVETLLIGIYNLEIIDKSGQPKVISFRIPSIAQASIYHEPNSLCRAFLTETCLRRWEECNSKLVNWGPLPQVEFLNAQNRLRVVTALVFIYNRQLGRLSNTSLEHLCKVSSKLVSQGFHSSGAHVRLSVDSDSSHTSNLTPRIALSSQLLLEILHALHYALFDGNVTSATQALEDMYNRACYESYTDVLLVANSIKNLLLISRSGISDGIMNMNLVHSTTTTTPAPVSKSMITNASFRTKKLPDDIPIQTDKDDGEGGGLVSISEEKEEDERPTLKSSFNKGSKESSSALAGVKNFPKTISGLGKKVKETKAGLKSVTQSSDKDKDKDKADNARRSIEIEKEAVKYLKDDLAKQQGIGDDLDFKRIVTTDNEKVSLVSDSIKTSEEGVTENGATNLNDTLAHNAIHVSSV